MERCFVLLENPVTKHQMKVGSRGVHWNWDLGAFCWPNKKRFLGEDQEHPHSLKWEHTG